MTQFNRDAWLENMRRVYAGFADATAALPATGMKPDPVYASKAGGYLVAFGFNSYTVEEVGLLGQKIVQAAPSLFVYPGKMLHVSIVTACQADGFYAPKDPQFRSVLDALCGAAQKAGEVRMRAALEFNDGAPSLLCNQTTAILATTPVGAYGLYVQAVLEESAKRGLQVRAPWGSHMTIARSTQVVSPQDSVALASLCHETQPPFRYSKCCSLDVGHYYVDADGVFCVEWVHSTPLFDD